MVSVSIILFLLVVGFLSIVLLFWNVTALHGVATGTHDRLASLSMRLANLEMTPEQRATRDAIIEASKGVVVVHSNDKTETQLVSESAEAATDAAASAPLLSNDKETAVADQRAEVQAKALGEAQAKALAEVQAEPLAEVQAEPLTEAQAEDTLAEQVTTVVKRGRKPAVKPAAASKFTLE